jgi:protein SCO1/2
MNRLYLIKVLTLLSLLNLASCLRFDLSNIETEPNCDLSQKSCQGLLPDGEIVHLQLASEKPAKMGESISFQIKSESSNLVFNSMVFKGAEMEMGEFVAPIKNDLSQVTLATCLEDSMVWKVIVRGENVAKKEKFGLVFRFLALKNKSEMNAGNVAAVQDAPMAYDFELPSNTGKIHLSDFKNHVRLLYFGFTTCPDICPTTLSNVKQALKKLSEEEKKQVKLFFITVDPERDNVTKLKEYLNYFDKDFIPLVGSIKDIETVAKAYGAFFKKVPVKSAMKYTMDHSASLFVVGKSGRYERVIVGHVSTDELANVLKSEIVKGKK